MDRGYELGALAEADESWRRELLMLLGSTCREIGWLKRLLLLFIRSAQNARKIENVNRFRIVSFLQLSARKLSFAGGQNAIGFQGESSCFFQSYFWEEMGGNAFQQEEITYAFESSSAL